MICSECGRFMKPVVAVDVDGTLGDYHEHLCRFAGVYLDALWPPRDHPAAYDGSVPFSEWFCEWFTVDIRTFRDIKLAYRQGAQKRSLPPFPNAVGFTKRLQEMGAEVWITTTRPYNRLDNIDPDTRAWLKRHDNPFDYAIFDDNKYTELSTRVTPHERVIAILDDLPEQFEHARSLFGADVPIFRRNRYNRGVPPRYGEAVRTPSLGSPPVVTGWVVEYEPYVLNLADALAIIKQRIDTWKEKHPIGS